MCREHVGKFRCKTKGIEGKEGRQDKMTAPVDSTKRISRKKETLPPTLSETAESSLSDSPKSKKINSLSLMRSPLPYYFTC